MTAIRPATPRAAHTWVIADRPCLMSDVKLSLQFFGAYTHLLQSENYVTRRQSLKVQLPLHTAYSQRALDVAPSAFDACLHADLLYAYSLESA